MGSCRCVYRTRRGDRGRGGRGSQIECVQERRALDRHGGKSRQTDCETKARRYVAWRLPVNVLLNEADCMTRRLGFGLSKLMRVPHRKDRRRLLEAAFDHGIRHFDVARMYGLGLAEKELGEFIRSKRDEVVVATKFGIEPQGAVGYVARLQSPIRWLFKRFPGIRAMATRSAQQSYRPKQFTPGSARTSLEMSLRMLKSDYVDMFFLHEPNGEDRISDDLCQCLEDLKTQGKKIGRASYRETV